MNPKTQDLLALKIPLQNFNTLEPGVQAVMLNDIRNSLDADALLSIIADLEAATEPAPAPASPMSKKEATRMMNGVAYVYDQATLLANIVHPAAFPKLAPAINQLVAIYDFIGARFGIAKPATGMAGASASVADVINSEIARTAAAPATAHSSAEESAAREEAEAQHVAENAQKGGDYGGW